MLNIQLSSTDKDTIGLVYRQTNFYLLKGEFDCNL